MTSQPEDARDRRLVEVALRGGLAIASSLLLAGLAARWFGSPGPGKGLLGAGVMTLALTPASRVLLLVGLWARERDWRFVLVALIVAITLVVAALL